MSRRSAIHTLANDIISILAINQFPVNMELLIKELGGQLQYGEMKENYSCIIKKANYEWLNNQVNFLLYIDKKESYEDNQYSLAHALGHLFLHMHYLIDKADWRKTNDYFDSIYERYGYGTEEREADAFAISLLVPRDELRRKYRDLFYLSKESLFIELQNHFGVSAETIKERLCYL
ncbi:ImmA/IrrE family metallo-endopeptidase [Bacillus thuringiensis]|uniref:ImmA/IrrE family metallo-endopeptidase n=1 Tax=Bacillus thuringiensis TaxID=1428 RepID=UPI0011AA6FBF|nr:ImmA/IrrE family metallo-endopeptidase [Bacillus thuringiensis]